MDFVRSHFGKKKLWPVQLNTFGSLFFPDSHRFSADLEKKWAKSVQLVRVSFFLGDFLQNPYFRYLVIRLSSFYYKEVVRQSPDSYENKAIKSLFSIVKLMFKFSIVILLNKIENILKWFCIWWLSDSESI